MIMSNTAKIKGQATTFPTLFKKSKTGKIQRWAIWVKELEHGEGELCIEFGFHKGKLQTTKDVVKKGKNLGKKNQTTPYEQALSEAKSKWVSQLESGYVESVSDAESGKVNEQFVKTTITPMKAHDYAKQHKKLKAPLLAQPKLDGIRCKAVVRPGKTTLWTYNGKPITMVPHIINTLEKTFPNGNFILDGELYNHEYKDNFESVVSKVRKSKTLDPDHELIQYHVYDFINFNLNQKARTEVLQQLFAKYGDVLKPCIQPVDGVTLYSKDEVKSTVLEFIEMGYEGGILRNLDGLYVESRSYDVLKYKIFQDDEFEIIGANEGRGKNTGRVGAFVCKTQEGNEFKCPMNGSKEYLKELFENPNLWKGKMLTVTFLNYTKKNRVPRHPKGKAIRDYE